MEAKARGGGTLVIRDLMPAQWAAREGLVSAVDVWQDSSTCKNRQWEPTLGCSASKFFAKKNVWLSRVYSKVSDRLIIIFKQENDIFISDYQRYFPFLLPKRTLLT